MLYGDPLECMAAQFYPRATPTGELGTTAPSKRPTIIPTSVSILATCYLHSTITAVLTLSVVATLHYIAHHDHTYDCTNTRNHGVADGVYYDPS
jgi:hypothetical protein